MTDEEAIKMIKAAMKTMYLPKSKSYISDLGYALEWLIQRHEQKWIPVSERLPKEHTCADGFIEPSEYVLVQHKSGYMKVSRYWGSRESYKDKPWIDLSYPTTETVVAWMPLPKPYKAESEDKE